MAKQPRDKARCNRDLCDFDPPDAGGRKSCRTGPDGLVPTRLYQQNRYIQYPNNCLPVACAIRGSFPHPPAREEGVPGHAPGNPKGVLCPRYMLVQCISIGAKAPVHSAAPNREAKGVRRGASTEAAHSQKGRRGPRFPKGKSRVPRREIRSGAAMTRSKTGNCELNSHPFRGAFTSGIDHG